MHKQRTPDRRQTNAEEVNTHCGCSLYRVPSTPTVISRRSNPLFSLILSTTAAIPAPHNCAARLDTAPHTVLTMMLSSQVLLSPSCWRMARTCSKASLSLHKQKGTVLN